MQDDRLVLEAELTKTGKEWEVTIIGSDGANLLEHEGKRYVVSKNGRLYDVTALKDSAPLWEGVKVYDNHLTDAEFEQRRGMRSALNEWVGVITKPYWDDKANKLKARLKVIDDRLIGKLRNAWEAGVLQAIGLSIDTLAKSTRELFLEGRSYPVIDGFGELQSVDIVGKPAAGGAFERLIAAHIITGERQMDEETKQEYVTVDMLDDVVSQAVAKALEAKAQENDVEVDDLTDQQVMEAVDEKNLTAAQKQRVIEERKAQKARREVDLARTELTLERKLAAARLPEAFEGVVRSQFNGKVADEKEITEAIKQVKEAHASLDPSGKVRGVGGHDIHVGLNDAERFELEFGRLMMGNVDFKKLEHIKDDMVVDRIKEAKAYKAWVNAGKPDLPYYNRISSLIYDFAGGDPLLRGIEAATTSTLTTVVKNTVNIMTANDYSQRERWFEPIVKYEEVDTIDDSTLARVHGVNSLSTVNEGQAYTELAIADEEETASFVKRGNYIGITLETLMGDKINYVRSIPRRLADAWYNTQSDLVSAVFTTNSAAGPVLSDTGALFNATALTSAGGHANLLTTALSHAQFSTVRTAMRKQTDQPLGAGRKLLLSPKYILVPVDLEVTALDIRNSENVPAQSGGATTGGQFQTVNNFRGQFEVIVVPTWTDTNNWAAVADPNIAPAIWLIYPRGQRTPQIFSADSEMSGAMFTNDELRFKVRLMTYRFSSTYDCAPVSDFRALHKSNVA